MGWVCYEPTALCNQIFHPSTSIEMKVFHVGVRKVHVGVVCVVTGIIKEGLPWVEESQLLSRIYELM